MLIVIPSYPGDFEQAERLVRACVDLGCVNDEREFRHAIIRVHRRNDGTITPYNAVVAHGDEWPGQATVMFTQVVHHLPAGEVFLWLEPDACPTHPDAFDDLEDRYWYLNCQERYKRLCCLGDFRNNDHYSGVAVYRVTQDLIWALSQINKTHAFDTELYRCGWCDAKLRGKGCAAPTDLIADLWRTDRPADEVLKANPGAAVIHGVKDASLIGAVLSKFQERPPCQAG